MDGWMDGWIDRLIVKWMHGWTHIPACMGTYQSSKAYMYVCR